ncbi:hypothetical protein ACJX0J_015646, partial [Zea mays]
MEAMVYGDCYNHGVATPTISLLFKTHTHNLIKCIILFIHSKFEIDNKIRSELLVCPQHTPCITL